MFLLSPGLEHYMGCRTKSLYARLLLPPTIIKWRKITLHLKFFLQNTFGHMIDDKLQSTLVLLLSNGATTKLHCCLIFGKWHTPVFTIIISKLNIYLLLVRTYQCTQDTSLVRAMSLLQEQWCVSYKYPMETQLTEWKCLHALTPLVHCIMFIFNLY